MLWRIKIIFKAIFLAISTLLGELCILFNLHQIPEWLYKLGLKVWPDNKARWLADLGFVYERAGKLEEARECYKEVCKLEPQDSSHYVHLGYIYEKQNNIKLAIENYEKFLQIDTVSSKVFREEIQSKINRLKEGRGVKPSKII